MMTTSIETTFLLVCDNVALKIHQKVRRAHWQVPTNVDRDFNQLSQDDGSIHKQQHSVPRCQATIQAYVASPFGGRPRLQKNKPSTTNVSLARNMSSGRATRVDVGVGQCPCHHRYSFYINHLPHGSSKGQLDQSTPLCTKKIVLVVPTPRVLNHNYITTNIAHAQGWSP